MFREINFLYFDTINFQIRTFLHSNKVDILWGLTSLCYPRITNFLTIVIRTFFLWHELAMIYGKDL